MNRYRRILVSLNLTDLDPTVMAYTRAVVQLLQPDRVDLVHVVDTRDLPLEISLEYPSLVESAAGSAAEAIRDLMNSHDLHATPRCDVQAHVYHAPPVETLLQQARTGGVDLIIAGRDPDKERSATLPERLSQQGPCSVLSVPQGAKPTFGNILVPVDFSPHSATALERAVTIARAAGVKSLTCLHVYDVPGSYRHSGRTYDEFAAIMNDSARRGWERFRHKVDRKGVELCPVFRHATFPSQAIRAEVSKTACDLVVMGARGQSAPKNMLLGSVSQRVLNKTTVPLLVVKSKRDSTSLLCRIYDTAGDE